MWPRTSRQSRGYGRVWEVLREEILARDFGLCVRCQAKTPPRVTPATEVHHRNPRAAGGTDDPSNLESTCHECHLEADAANQGRKVIKRGRVLLDGTVIYDSRGGTAE